jgi:hypothetical protein
MASTLVDDVSHDLLMHASDFLPSPAEARQLRTAVAHQENSIHALNGRIAHLEGQLRLLRAQRTSLLESSTVKKALLAPIRKLAPETLGEIFELCSSSSATPGVRRIITPDSVPILMGSVCRKWRRVALGTPQLWTSIALEHTTDTPLKVNPFLAIPQWLSRSGCLPLEIYIGDGLEKLFASEKHSPAFRSCMTMLGDHFHRCRSFHITNAFPDILSAMFPPGRCRDASSLREIRVIPSIFSLPQRPLILGQIAAPNLESIDVYRPSTFFHSITLDYSRLRSLRWNSSIATSDRESSLENLTQVLSLCPNLEDCDIMHPSHTTFSLDRVAVVSVPSLRRLRLKFTLQADPSPLFSVLRTPGLESLTLEQVSPISNVPGFGGALSTFISAAPPPLKELRMIRLILSAEDAVLLSPLSRLESLQLHNCFLHPAFLAALTPKAGDHPDAWTVPKLSSICLNSSAFGTEMLAEVVERRLAVPGAPDDSIPTSHPRLSSVSLNHCRLSRADQITLTMLTKTHGGLSVDISDSE